MMCLVLTAAKLPPFGGSIKAKKPAFSAALQM